MTLAERGVALLRAGGADPVLVVTGAAPELGLPATVTGAAPDLTLSVYTVYNPGWRTGMGSSLRAALTALGAAGQDRWAISGVIAPQPAQRSWGNGEDAPTGDEVGAVVVALADQPLVGEEAVRRLIGAYRGGASVAVAAYDGRPRNPVLIAREHWADVAAAATGDAGARGFLRARPELVTLIECGDTGRPDDIDTPDDLARIIRTDTR